MLVAAILCIFVGFSSTQAYTANSCGERPLQTRDSDKIVGGVAALRGDWPWSCSMRYGSGHICGGSLLNGQWIITAAHCVTTSSPASSYKWRCGHHERNGLDTWAREFTSTRYIVHPQYNSAKIQNDIALFQISSTDIQFTDYILPVCYPAASATHSGATSWATGWGTLSSGGSLAAVHMEVAMPVLPDAECQRKFPNMIIPATQICAGAAGASIDTCQGDSGGPLVYKRSGANGLWEIIGLTSWGYGCGDGGVYTRCAGFRNWVTGYVGQLPTGDAK